MNRSLFVTVLFLSLFFEVSVRADATPADLSRNKPDRTATIAVRYDPSDDEFEEQIAEYMKNDGNQRRTSLVYSSILGRIARERAHDMAQRNYFSHVNPDGIGPNYLVTKAGFRLPDHYNRGASGNNIESIAAGNDTAAETWDQWMNSPGHRKHILGLADFYAEQTQYGIGHAYVENSRYRHYWVIITAPASYSGRAANPRRPAQASNAGVCTGDPTRYPNVIKRANGKLAPACGYTWVSAGSNDFRVKLKSGLAKNSNGKLYPANGYTWVEPDDPEDLRVKRTSCRLSN